MLEAQRSELSLPSVIPNKHLVDTESEICRGLWCARSLAPASLMLFVLCRPSWASGCSKLRVHDFLWLRVADQAIACAASSQQARE